MHPITKFCSNIVSPITLPLALTFAFSNAIAAPAVAAEPPMSMSMPMPMPMSAAKKDAQLLRAFLEAGGGAADFSTTRLMASLTVSQPSEIARLHARFGNAAIQRFVTVLDYVVASSTTQVATLAGSSLPNADSLAFALYRAGAGRGNAFSIERLFDVLFGHAAHMQAMGDVARRFGASGEIAYHQVLTALVEDVGKTSLAKPIDRAGSASVEPAMNMASPLPQPSPTPMDMKAGESMQMSGTQVKTNANGVMSMYGQSKMRPAMGTMSMREMPGVADLGVPMSREGSGTAWLPDSSTTFGHMSTSGEGMLMTHGAGFVRYSDTSTDRGSRTPSAPNWYMLMGSHPLGPASQLGARIMLTADFLTVGGYGYPELFQTGESFRGAALHDHQHPHDLFSEAALTYSHRLSPTTSASLYAGYPGEPALGPPTYMHRLIAYDMVDAPIGHHWQDATHITFGVVTAGLTAKNVKIEASAFTGREPNEIRTNFDPVHLDSTSARISWNPTAKLATQFSYGFIKSPEALAPQLDQHRTTASILYNEPIVLGEFFTASVVWGQNMENSGTRSNAYLLEGDLHRRADSVYGRAEFVQKSGGELVLSTDRETLFPIGAYTLGYVHDFKLTGGTAMGLGSQVTLNTRPNALVRFYGPQTPIGFEIFARFRPTAIR